MFSKLTNNMFKNKKYWLLLIALMLLVLPVITHAADGGLNATEEIKKLFSYLNILLLALQAFLWPILLLLGSLLNNDLLFSGGMQTILLNIWTAVRDFVNIMFVLGLLAVAIANIMGINKDSVALKTILPHIIIGLIAVNFSFLACKVVLDVVNVTSTSIFSIPLASDSLKKYTTADSQELKTLSSKVCDKMQKQLASTSTKDPKATSGETAFCKSTTSTTAKPGEPTLKYELTDLGKSFFSTFNSRNAALVMAIELQDIVNIDNVNADKIKDLKDLAINSIFSIIFFIIYATAFVALFVAMLVRVVVLWLTIAISPISFLGYAFPSVKNTLGENDPFKLFLSHALIPLKVSIILTIGMIMISQLKNISGNSINSTDPASLGAITTGMSTVQDLIAGMATAAFIWIAAFEAFKGTKATGFVDKIRSRVGEFGSTLAKLPLYAPIIPGPGGSKVGLAALGAGAGLTAGLQQKMNDENTRFNKLFGGKDSEYREKVKSATGVPEAKTAIGSLITNVNVPGDKDAQKAIAEAIKKNPTKYIAPAAYNGNIGKFTEALEKGEVKDQAILNDFMAKNKIDTPLPDKSASLDSGKKASDAAKTASATNANPALTAATAQLDAALKELDSASTPAATKVAQDKVEKATKKVTALTAAKTKIDGISNSPVADFEADGKMKNVAAFNNAKTIYAEAKAAGAGDDAAVKQMLIAKLQKMPGMNETKAKVAAEQIIAGTPPTVAPPVPPVAPTTPPPAPTTVTP